MLTHASGLNLQNALKAPDSIQPVNPAGNAINRSVSIDDSSNLITSDSSTSASTSLTHKDNYFTAKPIERNSQDWTTGLILFCFLIYAWIRFKYKRRTYQIIQAFLAKNYANQFAREGNLFKENIFLPLMVIAVISISVFIHQSFSYYKVPFYDKAEPIIRFLIILLIFVSFWIAKVILIKILEVVFETADATYDYLLNIHIHLIIIGLIILPLLVFTTYITPRIFIPAGMVLSAMIYLMWLYRGFSIGLKQKDFSVSHLFLYLCTFEILPVTIFAKLLINNN